MRKIATLILVALSVNFASGQSSWEDVGPNFATNSINPKVIALDDTVFVAYINPSNNLVELKKNVNDTWQLVGSYPTTDNKFDFDLTYTNSIILSTVTKSPNEDNSAFEFNLVIREYKNGQINQVENQYIGFGPQTNNFIDIFDVSPMQDYEFGGYGCVFRYNNSFLATYLAKTGENPWYTTNYSAPGGNSGVKDSKIICSQYGSIIFSRNQTLAGGTVDALVAHYFLHNSQSSVPLASSVPTVYPEILLDRIYLSQYQNDFFISATRSNFEPVIFKQNFINNQGNIQYGNLEVALTFTDDKADVKMITGNDFERFVAYIDFVGSQAQGKVVRYDEDFTNPTVLGNVNYNEGNGVGEFDIFYENGLDIYVAYQYGPPFNNSKVKRYGCPQIPEFTYDADENLISTTATFPAGTEFLWYPCGGFEPPAIEGATSATFTPTEDGSYFVFVANGECGGNSTCVEVIMETGGGDVSVFENELHAVNLYPNPVQETVFIENLPLGTQVQLINTDGKVLQSETTTSAAQSVDVSNFPAGMYFIQLNTKNNTIKTYKISIQN